jgi:predicted DCC family thiol-disulfide oxidoreductase YuxK
MPDSANPVLLYDGVCGLCNRVVQFILKHDDKGVRFRFASLQSDYAARVLHPYELDPQQVDTVCLTERPGEPPKTQSDAVISVLRVLGGFWSALATALRIFPRPLRDWGYRPVARHRYRIFGKYESCMLPAQKYQDRFLDR